MVQELGIPSTEVATRNLGVGYIFEEPITEAVREASDAGSQKVQTATPRNLFGLRNGYWRAHSVRKTRVGNCELAEVLRRADLCTAREVFHIGT